MHLNKKNYDSDTQLDFSFFFYRSNIPIYHVSVPAPTFQYFKDTFYNKNVFRDCFQNYGKVDRVKKIKDYAFIHFEDRDQAIFGEI